MLPYRTIFVAGTQAPTSTLDGWYHSQHGHNCAGAGLSPVVRSHNGEDSVHSRNKHYDTALLTKFSLVSIV